MGALPESPTSSLPPERVASNWDLARSEYEHYAALKQGLLSTIEQKPAEQATVRSQMAPLAESLSIQKKRGVDLDKLLDGKYVGRHEYLSQKQSMVDMGRRLPAQHSTLNESEAALSGAQEQLRALVTETMQAA